MKFNLNYLYMAEEKFALRKTTPVARKWAANEISNGKTFAEVEEKYLKIKAVEDKLYGEMKETLTSHISRHGLDAYALAFFEEFQAIECFDKNAYNSLLKKIRRAYAQSDGNRSLEYLLAKIGEYMRKISDLNKTAWEMLVNGQEPDFRSWSDQVILQDNLFEENKQFLKQTLHHLELLEKNKVKMGVPEIKLLLYHKEGCRREKLYRRTEEWVIRLFMGLQTDAERQSVYKDICQFLAELVPEVGYISPFMVKFIFSNGYVSENTRDLLVKVQPVIKKLSMSPIIYFQLEDFYMIAKKHLKFHRLNNTDRYVYQLLNLYAPSEISPEEKAEWENALKE